MNYGITAMWSLFFKNEERDFLKEKRKKKTDVLSNHIYVYVARVKFNLEGQLVLHHIL